MVVGFPGYCTFGRRWYSKSPWRFFNIESRNWVKLNCLKFISAQFRLLSGQSKYIKLKSLMTPVCWIAEVYPENDTSNRTFPYKQHEEWHSSRGKKKVRLDSWINLLDGKKNKLKKLEEAISQDPKATKHDWMTHSRISTYVQITNHIDILLYISINTWMSYSYVSYHLHVLNSNISLNIKSVKTTWEVTKTLIICCISGNILPNLPSYMGMIYNKPL